MDSRLAALPADVACARAELHELLAPRVAAWRAARVALTAELEQVEAVAELGATSRTFVVGGWAERAELPRLRLALEHAAGEELALDELPNSTDRLPPVLLRNRQSCDRSNSSFAFSTCRMLGRSIPPC